jgi:8-oxo-dGTP pyrophosphatase MutT (NUDIX family)
MFLQDEFIEKLKLKICSPLPGFDAQMLMAPPVRNAIPAAPDNAKQSGVLILLFQVNNSWHTLLMQRTVNGSIHSGQISFPGGKLESSDASITYAAIRECSEEVGINYNQYQILGSLTPLYVPPSNFMVTPVVAFCNTLPTLKVSPNEVQQVHQIKLTSLFANKSKQEVLRSDNKNLSMLAPVYLLDTSTKVWGATAMILSELEVLCQY